MLIEIWERLRGYDHWVPATAKVHSSRVQRTAHPDRSGNVTYTWASQDQLVWADDKGQEHSAEFTVPDDSPLYQYVGGETVSVRYDPSNPDRFYFRDLLRSRLHTVLKVTVYTLLFVLFLAGLEWLHFSFR
jgi:hypothetical protein